MVCEIKIKVRKVEKRLPIESGRKVQFESLQYDVVAEYTLKSDRKETGNIILPYAKNMFGKVQEAIDYQKAQDGLPIRNKLLSESIEATAIVDNKVKSIAVV